MLTTLRKIGLVPVFEPGLESIDQKIYTLVQAGVPCAAFSVQDVDAIHLAASVPGFIPGVTEVSSMQEAQHVAAYGARFIVVSGPSAGQAAWAQQSGMICVPASQLPGGICPIPTAVAQDLNQLTQFIEREIRSMLAFDLRHVGINCPDADTSSQVASTFEQIFGFPKEDRGGAYFAGEVIEVMKKPFYGTHGHIAICSRSAESAVYHLAHRGVKFNWQSAGYTPDGRLRVIYLQEEIGGFAVHVLQK